MHLPNSLHEPRVKSLVVIFEVNPSSHTGYRNLGQNNHESSVSLMDQDLGYLGKKHPFQNLSPGPNLKQAWPLHHLSFYHILLSEKKKEMNKCSHFRQGEKCDYKFPASMHLGLGYSRHRYHKLSNA